MPAKQTSLTQRTLIVLLLVPLLAGAYFEFHSSAFPGPAQEQNVLPAVVGNGSATSQYSSTAAFTAQVAVEGWVTDSGTSSPIAGASVRLGEVTVYADPSGHFSLNASQLGQTREDTDRRAGKPQALELKVTVQAPGYTSWTITGARYYKGDTLRLYPRLQPGNGEPMQVRAADVQQGARAGDSAAVPVAPGPRSVEQGALKNTNASALAPPATIRVYRTQTQQVEVVPFRDYVKHVLPNEWISSWNPEALKAGAMATKMYAWYWISQGGKQRSLGADVKDNVDDQVYDPNVSYASTDSAVDATLNYAMTINGALFPAQYCAGSYGADPSGDCPWSSLYMTQWGSAYYADQGRPWGWILQFYYTGSVITPNPPGGGYTGTPLPRATRTPGPAATPAPPSGGPYSVGQGSDRADLFQQAFTRAGGTAALGSPTGPARWWLTYVTDANVQAQRFSGPDGRNNIWIVYDVLKASSQGVHRAFVLSGDIAAEYAAHTPPGPEWIGAPTSDPYTADSTLGGSLSQGFTNGTLVKSGVGVQFAPWPQQFSGWEAKYFAGHDPLSPQSGAPYSLLGQPALVRDVPSPSFDWTGAPNLQAGYGVGKEDWSVQFTKDVQVSPGSYDFAVTSDGGTRLWVDGVLAIDSWQPRQSFDQVTYTADLGAGPHRVRLQYFRLLGGGRLQFDIKPHGSAAAPPAPSAAQPTAPPAQNSASLRISVQWLGRGASPSDRWVLPLTLQLSVPGNPSVVTTFRGTTDRNGVAFFNALPVGVYDVHVKGPHSLQSARASVNLTPGTLDLDMKAQVEGDANGDNCVTPDDLSIVQSLLGVAKGAPGFDPAADLNGDGTVTMADLSLLRSGFDQCGDISVDANFQILSTNAAPMLADTLAPWLNAPALPHDLSLASVPRSGHAKPGDVVTVDVVVQAGAQAIDGAAFVLHYDPQRFAPVDSGGKANDKVEPGLLLPAVMGDWIDTKSGTVGYSGGMVQGTPPNGRITVARARFRVLPGASAGVTTFSFEAVGSSFMQITNGGENLLGLTLPGSITIDP